MNVLAVDAPPEGGGIAVLRNRPFLLLWLAQLSTQVGGNMVMLGLLVIITSTYSGSKIAISILLLCFLAPAIIFSAIAGVFSAWRLNRSTSAARVSSIVMVRTDPASQPVELP